MPKVVVGRERELADAEAFLRRAGREPAALVIEGDPGIGKTTLWLSVARTAEDRGYRVLRARPAESENKLSFAALADLLDPVFDQTRSALPPPQERAMAAALLRSEVEGPTNVRTIGAAVVRILELLAGSAPVLLAIDDAQWLDADSDRVLMFALRRLPTGVGLLAAWRTTVDGELAFAFDRAFAPDRIERITLGPLSNASIHHLVKQRLGSSLSRPMITRLGAAAAGNPFFALEILRALGTDTHDVALGDPLPVPRSLMELVSARLQGLSEAARDVLLIAATLFRPTVAEVTSAMPDGDVGLYEAETAGVIESEGGRLRFAHPLLASAVYAAAPADRRVALHRRLADVVSSPEERARHLAQSDVGPDAAIARSIAEGARQAALRGAQDAAAELFDASIRVTPEDGSDERADRLLGCAIALNAVGDFSGARERAEDALEACRTPDVCSLAHVFLGTLAWFEGSASVAVDHLERALAAAGEDRRLRGPIYAKLARFSFTHDFRHAVQRADDAMRFLDERREPQLLAQVLIDRFFGDALLARMPDPGLLERGLALEERALPESSEAPHPIPLIWFLCTDAFDEGRARYSIEDAWYRVRGEDVWRANRRAHLALIELRAGAWERAERYAEESCAALADIEVHGPMALIFEKRALVDAHLGRIERARATLAPIVAEFESTGQAYWAALALSSLAFVEYAAGDHRAVDELLGRMRRHSEPLGVKDNVHDRSEPLHVESLLALGETARARAVLDALDERGRRLPRGWISATLPRARALVLSAEGDHPGALDALSQMDPVVAARLPLELGWALEVKGRVLRRAKQKRAAAEALAQALDIFEGLGAAPWIERTRDELRRVGLRPPAPDELTESERQVAELAAKGLRNREVAAELFMSAKTVEATLGRVYRKLGIHSRAELGAYVARFPDRSQQM